MIEKFAKFGHLLKYLNNEAVNFVSFNDIEAYLATFEDFG